MEGQMDIYDILSDCKKHATSKATEQTRRESNKKTNRKNMYYNVVKVLGIGTMTAREIAEKLYSKGAIAYPARAVIQPRITELVEDGKLVVVGKKFDCATNRNVAVYKRA